MPRYFFSCEGAQTFEDHEGTEFPDLHTARIQAIEQAGELARDYPGDFERVGWWKLTISDDKGTSLTVLTFELTPASTG